MRRLLKSPISDGDNIRVGTLYGISFNRYRLLLYTLNRLRYVWPAAVVLTLHYNYKISLKLTRSFKVVAFKKPITSCYI